MQWWIQDFRRGGAWAFDAGTFGENVCENERIGSHGGRAPGTRPLDPPMQWINLDLSNTVLKLSLFSLKINKSSVKFIMSCPDDSFF